MLCESRYRFIPLKIHNTTMWLAIIGNVALALTFVASLAYFYIQSRYSYWKKRNVITPEPTFFFGNIKETALRRTALSNLFRETYESFPNEKVVGIYRMWTPCLVVRDLEVLKHVMIKDFDQFVDRGLEFSREGLGVNLFHADSDTWRVLRSRLSPIFTSGKLKQMMPLMHQQADKFTQHLHPLVGRGADLDVWALVQKFTIATISSTAFGYEVDMADLDVAGNIFSKIDKLIFTPNYAMEVDMAFPGILKKLNMSVMPRFVNEFFYGMVEKVMKDRQGEPTGRNDFMDLMLELRNSGKIHGNKKHGHDKERSVQITEALMAAQAFVFYAAGYETSASTVSFLLRLLALHPDVQERVYREVQQLPREGDGQVSFEALKGMTYLGQVFDETLRMFPLIDPLQRCLGTATYRVPGTDLTIDKGTIVMVPVRGIHFDEQYYPDPERFDPERFTPENVKARHPCAYMPFGLGPRNCIGMRFAHVQSRLAIVTLLQKYRLEPTPDTKVHLRTDDFDPYRVILGPKGGFKLRLVPRD